VTEFQPPAQSGVPQRIVPAPDGTLWFTEADGMDVGRVTVNGSFQTIATPGLQNFDITVTPDNVVYFTARDIATQQDQLLALQPHVEMRRRSVKH
jgi:virginiamycin B lyase